MKLLILVPNFLASGRRRGESLLRLVFFQHSRTRRQRAGRTERTERDQAAVLAGLHCGNALLARALERRVVSEQDL